MNPLLSKYFFVTVYSIIIFFISILVKANEIGQLPRSVANNAVASAHTSRGWELFSFNGLLKNKDWQDVSNAAMGFNLKSSQGYLINSVPYSTGRLASIAVTVNNKIYLFGGYTVSQKHDEKSMPDVYQFNPETKTFKLFNQMPIPVDDSVALVYQNRYIYLISGWHDTGNVNDVQILDTLNNKWFTGTPFPGIPVFGHSAGIVNNQMVVVDGVKVAGIENGNRIYKMSSASYIGEIHTKDFTKIDWKRLPNHPTQAKYRMAAVGLQKQQKIIFAAGSDNPYNYNGIGYNEIPSQPSNQVFSWNLKTKQWQELNKLNTASMDHRGLINVEDKLFIIGGMLANQKISNKVLSYDIRSIELNTID